MSAKISKTILRTFVPVNAIAEDHLNQVVDKARMETLEDGAVIFSAGENDGETIYLLSGEISLSDTAGRSRIISAGGIESWHPIEPAQPRKATAVAKGKVNLVKINNQELDEVLAWDQSSTTVDDLLEEFGAENSVWVERLLKSNLFYRIPPANIREIFQKLETVPCKTGDVIIQQGDDADSCYFIKSGAAEVLVQQEGASEAVPVAILETGDWFGEEGLLSGSKRNATIKMAIEGEVMRLGKEDFDNLLKEPSVVRISYDEAFDRIDEGARWLDVRLSEENDQSSLPESINIPLNSLRVKSRLLDKNREYVVYCDTGRRSTAAAFLLQNLGFKVYVLDKGLNGLDE